MAYDSLKNIIRQYIKTNGEQEITGQIMQNVLIEMVNNYPSTEGCIRATLSNLANGDILVYDSVGAWYNTPMSSFLAGYATQLWVNQQGYVTSSALAGYIHPTLTNLANGDILIWDSVGAWVNAPLDTTISGFGYVKSTGSVAYATSAGSANILGHTVYENPAHALANGDMLVYDSGTGWTNVETSSILSGYATQSWVTSQGYITSSGSCAHATTAGSANILGHTVNENTAHSLANGDMLVYDSGTGWTNVETSSILSGYATQSWVTSQGYITASALNGYATQSWVTSQGYIQPTLSNLSNGDILVYDSGVNWVNTPISSFLAGYATESWVNQQGFLTSSALNGYIHPTLTNLANGDILIYDSVGAWVNTNLNTTVAGFGYITSSASITGNASTATKLQTARTLWGQSFDGSGNVSGSLTDVGSISATGIITISSLDWTYFGCSRGNDGISSIGGLDSSGVYFAHTQNDTTAHMYLKSGYGLRIYQGLYVAGNVGIGTTSPAYKLDVNGTLNATTIYQNGTALSSIFLTPNLSNLANGDILVYDTVGAWYNTSLSSFGFATQTWVGQQGYLTSSALNGYIHPTLTNLANGDVLIYDSVGAWVNAPLNTTIAGFGYITSSALTGYLPLSGGTMTGGFSTFGQINQFGRGSGEREINYKTYSIYVGTATTRTGSIRSYTSGIAFCSLMNYENTDTYINYPQGWIGLRIRDFSGTERSDLVFATKSGNSLGSYTGNNIPEERMCITYEGNVGIGTTSPSYKLSVNGIIYTNAEIYTDLIRSTGGSYAFAINNNDIDIGTTSIGHSITLRTNSSANTLYLKNDGSVGIGTLSPAYTLDVNGSANATTLYENGSRVITTANIGSQSVNHATTAGSANILGQTVSENTAHSLSNGDTLVYDAGVAWVNVASGLSDIRQKSVINYDAEPMFEAVANAPAIRFTWKDATYSFRRGIHVGSIAQYWQTTIPEAVTMDNDGMLSMQYDVIALLSTISVAKKVSEHERRIVILERENEELRKELAALKSA